jgi:hypothetical protein
VYSFTKAKVGLETSTFTPSFSQKALLKVVLPAPIYPTNSTTRTEPLKSITSSAMDGKSAREELFQVFILART